MEVRDDSIDVKHLAGRFFSTVEQPDILGVDESLQHEHFFRAWTRKEALIKAHGDGLSLSLDQFGVSIRQEEKVRVKHVDWAPQTAKDWQLISFAVAERMLGAVATTGRKGKVEFWDYTCKGPYLPLLGSRTSTVFMEGSLNSSGSS